MLDVIAGYDPKDELTVFSVDRSRRSRTRPSPPEKRLDGVRIGVVRELLDKAR